MDDEYCSICGWLRPVANIEETTKRVICSRCINNPESPAWPLVKPSLNRSKQRPISLRPMKVLLVFSVLTILLHHGFLLMVASLGIEDHVNDWTWQWVAFPALVSVAFLSVAYLAHWSFQ